MSDFRKILHHLEGFESEVNDILSRYDSSPTRVMNLDNALAMLSGLSLKQESLFIESIGCLKVTSHKLYRAAIVLGWAAMADYLEEWLGEDNFVKVSKKKGEIAGKKEKERLKNKTNISQNDKIKMIAKSKEKEEKRWKFESVEALRDSTFSEHAIITAMYESGFFSRTARKALHALLNKRNECAHPSDHEPTFNEALGFIGELLSRIEKYQQKR